MAGISIIIKRIESINLALDALKSNMPKSKESENNLVTMFSLLPELKNNLEFVYKELKIMVPDFEIKFMRDGKIETW